MPLASKRAQLGASSTALSPQYVSVQCRSRWVKSWSRISIAMLTYSRPSCNTIRKEEKAAIRLVAFPHPDRGGHDARHLRCNPGIRPQSHHVQGVSGLNHSLPLLVLFFKDSAVSSPQVHSSRSNTDPRQLHILPGKNPHRPLTSRYGTAPRPHLACRHGHHYWLLRWHGSLVHRHAARRCQYGRRPLPDRKRHDPVLHHLLFRHYHQHWTHWRLRLAHLTCAKKPRSRC